MMFTCLNQFESLCTKTNKRMHFVEQYISNCL